jgi:hypothetical protein
MSKRPTSTPASQNILPENIFDTHENHEHDDEDPSAESLHNNAFMFNEIVFDEVPHVVDPNNDNNLFFPDVERFAYANGETPDIWEKVEHLSQLPPEDYFFTKVNPDYRGAPRIHPHNSKNLGSPKSAFCDFIIPFIINVLLAPTNTFLRSKGIKPTTYQEIFQLFLFELAQVCTSEKHSVMQENVASVRRDLFKKYGINGTWPCASRLQKIRSHLR